MTEHEPRPPRHHVDPRARHYWRVTESLWLLGAGVLLAVALLLDLHVAWVVLAALAVVATLAAVVVAPELRFRTHRWEATPTAVYSRSGWLDREWRIAPLSRVQTVEARRNPLHQLLGLSAVSVTTASSKGTIVIDGLDAAVADELVAALTLATEQTRGDAT